MYILETLEMEDKPNPLQDLFDSAVEAEITDNNRAITVYRQIINNGRFTNYYLKRKVWKIISFCPKNVRTIQNISLIILLICFWYL